MGGLHHHVHVGKGTDSGMPKVGDDLVGDAPDAAPGIVDVIADSPCVANVGSPFANVGPNAPLANEVLDIAVHGV